MKTQEMHPPAIFLISITLSALLSSASAQQLLLGPSVLTRGDEQEIVVSRLRRDFRLSLSPVKPGPDRETFDVTRAESEAVVGQITFFRSRLVYASARVADCAKASRPNCVLDAFFDAVLQYGGKRDNLFVGHALLTGRTNYSLQGSRTLGQCLPNGLRVVAIWPSPVRDGGESYVSLVMDDISFCEER